MMTLMLLKYYLWFQSTLIHDNKIIYNSQDSELKPDVVHEGSALCEPFIVFPWASEAFISYFISAWQGLNVWKLSSTPLIFHHSMTRSWSTKVWVFCISCVDQILWQPSLDADPVIRCFSVTCGIAIAIDLQHDNDQWLKWPF